MAKAIPHGTPSGYTYHKCRCDECKAAESEYQSLRRASRPENYRPSTLIRHGTQSGYNTHGCRCEECRSAKAKAAQRSRKNNPEYKAPVPSTPVPHGTRNGYQAYKCRCDECKAAAAEHRKRWAQDNPERWAAAQSRYRAANREVRNEGVRTWRKVNPEKVAAQELTWRKANPERRLALSTLASDRRRSRKRDAFVENVPRQEIFERDNWQCLIPGCLYPGVPASLDVKHPDPLLASIDHIVPLSKGGKHERSNLATAHLRCNVVKNDRIEGIA